jgi:DNA-binding NtrC family response regulator
MKKKIVVCVQKDINNAISWALKDLSVISAQYVDHLFQLEKVIESNVGFCGVIIDSLIDGQSTIPFIQNLRDKSKIKILLIISADTPKQEIVNLIQNKTVDNVIIRPFNANQIVDAVAKLCNIARPSETPWYMYTKPQ